MIRLHILGAALALALPLIGGPLILAAPVMAAAHGSTVNVVTDYGAVPDGATEDTAAFQAAISFLDASGGGTLVIPAGTYMIAPNLPTIGSNVTLSGDDAVLRAKAPGYQLLDLHGANIVVKGLGLDGANVLVRGMSIEAGSSNVVLSHDTVENYTQPQDQASPLYYAMPVGIKIYGDVNAVEITSSTIRNITATHPECNTGCTTVARGILISPAGGQTIATNVTVKDSYIAHVAPKDDGDCLVIQDSSSPAHLTVKNDTFDYCSKRAIKIQVPDATVTDNTIINPFDSSTPNPTYASTLPEDMYAAVSAYAPNVLVADNLIGGSGTFFNAIELGASCAEGISNVTVQDNVIRMGYLQSGTSLIRVMVPGTGLKIQDNFGSTADSGITAGTSELTDSTIRGNIFANVNKQFNNYATC